MGAPRLELTGERFGRMVVVAFSHVKHGTHWTCRCDCGTTKTVEGSKLRSGQTISCGCYMRECQKAFRPPATKHGHARGGLSSPTYRTWYAMIQRCTNPNNESYSDYGARGIRVCAEWKESFAKFLADMGERPPGKTIDRLDNDRGYEPSNCRWATWPEQRANQRNGGRWKRIAPRCIVQHDTDGGGE